MLKDLIKSRGYKQKFIANKIGVSEVTLSNWVKGKTIPNENHKEKLCALLEIPMETLQNSL